MGFQSLAFSMPKTLWAFILVSLVGSVCMCCCNMLLQYVLLKMGSGSLHILCLFSFSALHSA